MPDSENGGAETAPAPLAPVQTLTRIALFAALIGAGAFVYLPLGPLHLTLQTMLVMLTGFVLGPKMAAWALFAYLGCGFLGLPMFGRGKSGPASFFGPSAGYLAGFWVGAVVAGCSAYFSGSRTRRLVAMAFFGTLGSVLLLLLGAAGMRLTIMNDWHSALAAGMYPFLPGDILKMLAAAAVKEAFFGEKNRAVAVF